MNLVTGATGIIGSHVVLQLLQANKPVTACKRKGSDLARVKKLFSYYIKNVDELFSKINWIDLDVSDIGAIEDSLNGVDVVYHCAGFVSFNRKHRKKLYKINEEGTANVVNACLEKNVKLCHVSSVAAINNLDYKDELNESVFWKKNGMESDYAISKYNAEREVWRGIEEGLEAVIVNPGVVLSPGFWDQSSSRLFTTCYKGNMFYTNGSTGYVAAVDVAKSMIALVEKKQFSNRFIIIEDNYTFKHIFDHIQSEFGKRRPFINAGRFILQLGRIADGFLCKITGQEPTLTKAIINSALNTQKLSNGKLKEVLNEPFLPVNEAISQICAHYKADRK